jgi:hypothetical protein
MSKLNKWSLAILVALLVTSLGLTSVAAAGYSISKKPGASILSTVCHPWQYGGCCDGGTKLLNWRKCEECHWEGQYYVCTDYTEYWCHGVCPY